MSHLALLPDHSQRFSSIMSFMLPSARPPMRLRQQPSQLSHPSRAPSPPRCSQVAFMARSPTLSNFASRSPAGQNPGPARARSLASGGTGLRGIRGCVPPRRALIGWPRAGSAGRGGGRGHQWGAGRAFIGRSLSGQGLSASGGPLTRPPPPVTNGRSAASERLSASPLTPARLTYAACSAGPSPSSAASGTSWPASRRHGRAGAAMAWRRRRRPWRGSRCAAAARSAASRPASPRGRRARSAAARPSPRSAPAAHAAALRPPCAGRDAPPSAATQPARPPAHASCRRRGKGGGGGAPTGLASRTARRLLRLRWDQWGGAPPGPLRQPSHAHLPQGGHHPHIDI